MGNCSSSKQLHWHILHNSTKHPFGVYSTVGFSVLIDMYSYYYNLL